MQRGGCFLGFGRQRGGSLVELCVVIVLIGVLAALALPVFSRARDRALQAVCQNHLKQMGVATRLYLQYNDETYFPYAVQTGEGTLYYYGLERYSPGSETVDLDITRGYLFPYYCLASGVERCPAFTPPSSNGKKLRGATLGYGYNRFGVAGKRANAITRPESIVLFADCAHVVYRREAPNRVRVSVEEYRYVSPSEFTVHFRHAGEANVLFCDGHVESHRPVRVLSTLPKAKVGLLNELGDTSLFIP